MHNTLVAYTSFLKNCYHCHLLPSTFFALMLKTATPVLSWCRFKTNWLKPYWDVNFPHTLVISRGRAETLLLHPKLKMRCLQQETGSIHLGSLSYLDFGKWSISCFVLHSHPPKYNSMMERRICYILLLLFCQICPAFLSGIQNDTCRSLFSRFISR